MILDLVIIIIEMKLFYEDIFNKWEILNQNISNLFFNRGYAQLDV